MTHWPVICAYSAIAFFGKRIRGVHPPRIGTRTKHLKFLTKKWGKELISTNFMKMCMIFVPLFLQDTPMEWTPLGVRWFSIFIFQEVKRTWNQPDLSSVYMAACLLHLRNKSFASLLGDRRDLIGLIIRPDWLKTLSLAAELHGAERAAKQAVAVLQTNHH